MNYNTLGYRIFSVCNYIFLTLLAVVCLFPMIHVLALSFSESTAAAAGKVVFWPVDFTLASYRYVLAKKQFITAFGISLERVVLGTAVNMLFTVMLAYPLSKEVKVFKYRTLYVWIFVFTMLFSGGLVPWYMIIKYTGLIDSIWALIIPGAVPVWNVILLLNFFRGLPRELEEAAFIDGAGHWVTLIKIYLPTSLPALVTIILFTLVSHWNSWFDGLILMNKPQHYPLSSYLQTIIIAQDLTNITPQDAAVLRTVSDRTAKAAQIYIGAVPILCVYPFLQKYFTKGIVLGSVKG